MSNALQICASAYKQLNLDQVLVSFNMSEFPYNCALDLINTVIQEMNRKGRYWFAETSTGLTYTPGIYQYNLTSLNIDPKAIIRVRTEASGFQDELKQVNWKTFQRHYRSGTIQAGRPSHWSKFGNILELSTIPDQNYLIRIYHFQDIPLMTASTSVPIVPEKDEDILREGVMAYLAKIIGRPDTTTLYTLYATKVEALLADMKEDAGMPTQMPAAW